MAHHGSRQPSPRLEWIAGLLMPEPVREEVLGDLYEGYESPGQYLASALRLTPAVVCRRIRRTTDAQLAFLIALLAYLGYLGPAWMLSDTAPSPWIAGLLAAVTAVGVVIADAYSAARRPDRLRSPIVGTALALVAATLLALWAPQVALPSKPVAIGASVGLVLMSMARLLLPFDQPKLQAAGGAGARRSQPQSIAEIMEIGRSYWVVFLVLIVVWALVKKGFGL